MTIGKGHQLTAVSMLALLTATPAFGQALASNAAAVPVAPVDAPGDNAADGDIVVMGSILQAQRSSIEQKRNADNLIDVAAADAVGRFPDQNSAAALARLPAVAVQRDQGQERYIQVRGAPNRWTSVSIDGVPVVGVDEGGTTRAYRFDAIPAVLLSGLAINKSLTSDIQAEAIVASIDLRTYSPMSEKGLNVQGDLGYGFMELGGGEQRQGSLRASWSNDVVGVVIGGSHYRRKQVTDNREVGLYDASGPTEFDIRSYRLMRENNGLFAGVEFAPADGQRLWAKAIYTSFNDDEQRNQYEFRLDRAVGGTRGVQSGDLLRVPVRGTFNDGKYRTRNYINTIGGELEDGNGLRAAVTLNYTRTENTTDLPLIQASTPGSASPSLTYNFSDPRFPIVQLYSTVAGATPGSFARGPALDGFDQRTLTGTYVIPGRQDSFTDSYTAKLDLSKEFDQLTLSGGGLYADRTIDGFTFATSSVVNLAAFPAGSGLAFNVNDYVTDDRWDTNFPLGISFKNIDNPALGRDVSAILNRLQALGIYNPANDVPVSNRYALNERLAAGYAMAKLRFDAGQVIAGVRVEHLDLDNRGTALLRGNVAAPLSAGQSYTDVFPSLNARFDLSRDFVFRIAGQRGIARPSFGEIRVGSSIDDTASPGSIGGGNPNLRPEYTWGVDASLEYYLPGSGILSVAGFHRWVDNVLYANTQVVGNDAFDSGGVDRSAYLLTSTFNGESGRLYGVELNYQQQFTFLPAPFDGFGFQGNLTLLDGQFDTAERQDIRFPGTSNRIANASLYFEKYGLSARVSYQHRTRWLDTLGGLGIGAGSGDEYRAGYDNLDVAIRYAITDNIGVYADLNNLTNAIYWAYQGDESRPTEVEQIGRRFLFGIRFNF
ncbi:TonB-dependent receptor [Sphingomonas sp. OV641]|uniref:TonB-dependent receptor n=1 Tax=Sphingomonas sp. OV641 TaxID=1881068 RepID=UPI0008D11674|nr:TonB-dependent receptor [Sphingomonas sp. OV641]SEJ61875.1 TonB-dependent receptor [Sphingomonas sp. OV641]